MFFLLNFDSKIHYLKYGKEIKGVHINLKRDILKLYKWIFSIINCFLLIQTCMCKNKK